MPNRLSYHNSSDRSIFNSRMSGMFLLIQWFIQIPVFNANSEAPDMTPRSVASDLGVDCLPMSFK